MSEKPKQQRKSFLLRLPSELLEDLRRWSSAEVRSLNGHIEFLLRDALQRKRGDGSWQAHDQEPTAPESAAADTDSRDKPRPESHNESDSGQEDNA